MAVAVAPFDVVSAPKEYVPCALCGTAPTTVVTEQDRYGLPTRVVQCTRCSLRYLNPRMTKDAYAEFYQHGYRPLLQRVKPGLTLADIEGNQWEYAAALSNTVALHVARYAGGQLVDVGGSTGIVGRLFHARWGFWVNVVDPSPDELARARGCCTFHATAEDWQPERTYDVALLCRTIDHLLDPLGVLTKLRQCSTLLIVDAMDVDRWPANSRYKVDHPYAFTRATFHALVKAAGWQPVHEWHREGGRYTGLVCSPQE